MSHYTADCLSSDVKLLFRYTMHLVTLPVFRQGRLGDFMQMVLILNHYSPGFETPPRAESQKEGPE